MRTRARWGAAMAVLAMGLAACGGGNDAEADAEADSPLDGYLNEIWGEYDPNAPDPNRTRAEELVAACMADQGFEYYPVIEHPGAVYVYPEASGTLEFAQEFGYGYTTEARGPGTGTMNWQEIAQPSEPERRNSEYTESLSPDARLEYEAALAGDMAAPALPDDIDMATLDRGCLGPSYDAAYSTTAVPEQFTEVSDAVAQMWMAIDEDPRVTGTLAAWGPCMSRAGYPGLAQFIDAENLVNDVVNSFTNATSSQIDHALGATEYDAIKASVPEELAAVQDEEIAIAVADVTCREEVGYTRIRSEVENELEQAIVDTYRDDLEAWAAAAQAARAEQDG